MRHTLLYCIVLYIILLSLLYTIMAPLSHACRVLLIWGVVLHSVAATNDHHAGLGLPSHTRPILEYEIEHTSQRKKPCHRMGESMGGSDDDCETCQQVVLDLENRLNDPQLQDSVVDFVLANVCPLLPEDASRTCIQEARVVVAQIAASIQQSFDPKGVCKSMGLCGVSPLLDGMKGTHVLSKPWFCHGLDCPYFDIVESNDEYEIRRYKHGVWASTVVETYAYAVASPMGFRRLFDYIDEGNALGVKIPMTSPVKIRMEPSCGVFCKQNFTVSFYMPKKWQDEPPAPLDSRIFIERTKAMTVYVKSSSGYKIDDLSVASMAKSLAATLDEHGKAYDANTFVMAGYDPPFRLKHRHNEIWLTATDDITPMHEDDDGMVPSWNAVSVFDDIVDQLKRLAALPPFQESPESCDTCIDVIQQIATIIQEPENQKEVLEYLKQGCVAASTLQETCEDFVDDFGSILIVSIAAALVPDDVCTTMGYCSQRQELVRPF